jgi:rhodanese-related sulfurtransferase
MSLPSLSPAEAARRLREEGAILVDIRAPDEHARARIPGARNIPLAALDEAALAVHAGRPVLFHCRSGARTAGHAAALAGASAGGEAYIVKGGLDAWRAAGLPVAEDRHAPIEMMRQVQIAAGSFVLLGVLLGAFVAPGFYVLAGFVGAGLVFAGVSGTCAMASLLRRMPWNRPAMA